MEMLLLEMFDSLRTELSQLLEERHRNGTSIDTDSDTVFLNVKIAHLRNTLARIRIALGPAGVLLH